ncbi:KpsF/GutQ family sugar-phosphate isomerase [Hydrogenophaga laconesensis]|uniref:KpsF/GutQ family sugar-phosphate isomerase n=1 Tax=Hydrogenophaga laconesensis TaxID=1805971 RepID=UPI00286A49CD|nr:KpsF/GutQ family sugar-phosphate isomerase [Hydrogenophaga laconesensis]
MIALAGQVLEVEAAAILSARARLGTAFLSATDLLFSCSGGGRVVVIGMGKSGHIGRKIAATLSSTGTPALFVHPAEAAHGDLGMVTPHDVVLAISQSGKSDELLRVLPYMKRHRIPVVAMTAKADSALAQHADVVIDTSVDREACPLGLAPTASTTLALALGDAIAMCLLQARGFTAEMFAVTHPHGTLGRKLLVSIADVMVSGAGIPTARESATIREALVNMSRAGLGFVNVLSGESALVGVFTDGDLRRALDGDIDIKTVTLGEVIARKFVTIEASRLAVEAVELMEQHKISSMPVVDDEGRLVGAVNMRLLLQAGVV